jgi:lipopolysaccharide export system protein LptA
MQRAAPIVLTTIAAVLLLAPSVHAQTAATKQSSSSSGNGPPNALQGFSQNRDKPIRIDAERLEVRDKKKEATFFGDAKADVKVVQGDVTMRSKVLVVFYDKEDAKTGAGAPAPSASPGPGSGSQIRRLEAKGGVIVTQKDQTVTGDLGVFDMKTNKATVTGSVVMTQCENVLRGDRLVVDMTTGVSQVDGGRVTGLLQSQSGCGDTAPAAPAPAKKSAGPGSSDKPLPKSGK